MCARHLPRAPRGRERAQYATLQKGAELGKVTDLLRPAPGAVREPPRITEGADEAVAVVAPRQEAGESLRLLCLVSPELEERGRRGAQAGVAQVADQLVLE